MNYLSTKALKLFFTFLAITIFCNIAVAEKETPFLAQPFENITGYENDENKNIGLSYYFETDDDHDVSYEIAVNSDTDVAGLSIEQESLVIEFLSKGQTNVEIKATADGESVFGSFVVGVMPEMLGDYVVSDFENIDLDNDSYWNGSDESGGFSSGLAFFPNDFNPEWGTWSGWAYSNMANDTIPGHENQYSAITAAGMDAEAPGESIYGVSNVSGGGTLIKFENDSAHEVKGFYVTNSTYAALSMKYGDDFAKKFGGENGDDPDWFKLSIWGYEDGAVTDTIDFYLADYRFDDNTKNYIIQTWQWVDLSSLGKVDSLVTSLSSSDIGDWGMNTPAYFCMDNLYVVPNEEDDDEGDDDEDDDTSIITRVDRSSFDVFPNPTDGKLRIGVEEGGSVNLSIYNVNGQVIYQNKNYTPLSKIDITDQPSGNYIIRVQNQKSTKSKIIIKR